jgi:hypothetical protein
MLLGFRDFGSFEPAQAQAGGEQPTLVSAEFDDGLPPARTSSAG